MLAAANILSVLLQPAAAAFADTTGKISIYGLVLLLTGAAGFFAAARFLFSGYLIPLAAVFVLELTILFTLQPLLNAIGMQLINRGVAINFGLARGLGSLAYALCAVVLGTLTASFGTDLLTWVSVGLYASLGAAVFIFSRMVPAEMENAPVPAAFPAGSAGAGTLSGFLKGNRRFALLMAAVALVFCSHTMINNYTIQIIEHVGGTSREMGIASGMAAALELPAMVLFSFLVKKIRCSSILKFSLFFFVVKTGLTLAAASVWMFYAAQLFQFCSYALFIPASVYYVNEIIPKENLAKGQAFMTSAITLGGVLANLLGGWLLDMVGVPGMLAAGLAAAALGLFLGLSSTERIELKKSL